MPLIHPPTHNTRDTRTHTPYLGFALEPPLVGLALQLLAVDRRLCVQGAQGSAGGERMRECNAVCGDKETKTSRNSSSSQSVLRPPAPHLLQYVGAAVLEVLAALTLDADFDLHAAWGMRQP